MYFGRALIHTLIRQVRKSYALYNYLPHYTKLFIVLALYSAYMVRELLLCFGQDSDFDSNVPCNLTNLGTDLDAVFFKQVCLIVSNAQLSS